MRKPKRVLRQELQRDYIESNANMIEAEQRILLMLHGPYDESLKYKIRALASGVKTIRMELNQTYYLLRQNIEQMD